MGLILDSSVLISSERKGKNARQALLEISARVAGEDVAISVVTLIELAHGVACADTSQRRATRQQFLNELMTAVPVHPVSFPVALRAGRMSMNDTRVLSPSHMQVRGQRSYRQRLAHTPGSSGPGVLGFSSS